MIAPNDEQRIGRNDPCPCGKTDAAGNALKYKRCCMGLPAGGVVGQDAPKLEPSDMRTLLHVLLTKFQQLTRTQGVGISAKTFDEYPQDAKFNVQYDVNTKMFRFWVDPPEQKQQVIGPRRIVMPNGRM